MPNITVDCSEDILSGCPRDELARAVHDTVVETGLFAEENIKVRVVPHQCYLAAGKREAFIHITAIILPGRSVEQRAGLSRSVVAMLAGRLPDVKHLTMVVNEFNRETYFNRKML